MPSLKWVPGETSWKSEGDWRNVIYITQRVPIGVQVITPICPLPPLLFFFTYKLRVHVYFIIVLLVLSIFRFAETNRLSERYRGEYRENGLSLSFSWKAVSRIFPTKSSFHSCPSCHVPLAMNAVWGKTRKEFCVIIVARLSFPAHVEFVWLRFCTLFPGLFFYFHCFVHFFFSPSITVAT